MSMKKIYMLLMALYAITFMSGCGEKAERIIPEIKLADLSSSSISIGCDAQTVIVDFSSNVSWTATTNADWIVVSPSSGNTGVASVRINVQENTSHQPRNAVLTISDNTAESVVSITVNQEAAAENPVFSLDQTDFNVKADGGDIQLKVTHNIGYKIASMPDWVHQSSKKTSGNDDQYVFSVDKNNSSESREGVIVFCNDLDVCLPVNIKQAGATPSLSVAPESVQLSSSGGTEKITVTSNTAWKVYSNASWLKLNVTEGNGNMEITLSADENTGSVRSTELTVRTDDSEVQATVTVTQAEKGISLSVSPSSFFFSSKEENGKITIISNTSWIISKDVDWIELGANEGTGDATVSIIASENNGAEARKADIKVSTVDGSASSTITVQQKGGKEIFSIDKNEISVAAAGESFSVKVTHNIGYKITSLPDWISQTDKTTNGNSDTYTFKAKANTSSTPREGVIVFCNDNEVCIPVTVRQAGAKTNGENEGTSTGGKITLE